MVSRAIRGARTAEPKAAGLPPSQLARTQDSDALIESLQWLPLRSTDRKRALLLPRVVSADPCAGVDASHSPTDASAAKPAERDDNLPWWIKALGPILKKGYHD